MKKYYIFIALFYINILNTKAVERYWISTGPYGVWQNPLNWSGNTVPCITDVAVFNTNSVVNCSVVSDINVAGIRLESGYMGNLIILNNINVSVGEEGVLVEGGAFIIGTGIVEIWGILNVKDGVFSNLNGTLHTDKKADIFNSNVNINSNINYIVDKTILVPTIDKSSINLLTASSNEIIENIQYYDGLGRPIQSVCKQCSPNDNDIIHLQKYDIAGRASKQYLPYTQDGCSGFYRDMSNELSGEAFIQQRNFYTTNVDTKIPKTIVPTNGDLPLTYDETRYDPSPLELILEQGFAGETWRVKEGNSNRKTIIKDYRTNRINEVRVWTYDAIRGNATARASNNTELFYSPGMLYVEELTDENNEKLITYIDKLGNSILKTNVGSDGVTYSTYYVHDSKNRLRYIIPPNALIQLSSLNWNIVNGSTFVNEYLFRFNYDDKDRVIEKGSPSAGIEKNIYDNRDRLILSQDANMVQVGKWRYTKFDIYNRPVLSGEYSDTRSRNEIASLVKNSPFQYEYKSSSPTNIFHYTNLTFPSSISTSGVFSVLYYDNYDFDHNQTKDYNYIAQLPEPNYPNPIPTERAIGLLTGVRIRNMDNNMWQTQVFFYNKWNKTIQRVSNNHIFMENNNSNNLSDIQTNYYDFNKRVLKSSKIHNDGINVYSYYERFEYDYLGKIKRIFHKVGNNQELLLAEKKYNELGNEVESNLHSTDGGVSFLQSIDYRYNIRGWLTSINNSQLTNDISTSGTNDDQNDLFGMEIFYDKLNLENSNIGRYNGDVSSIKWSVSNVFTNQNIKSFSYLYDGIGRLSSTGYSEKISNVWTNLNKTNEFFTYDKSGNILSLRRYDENSSIIDDLVYQYNGNKIKTIIENANFSSGFTTSSISQNNNEHYIYDLNGNLKSDLNKKIDNISYNIFNKPSIINFNDGGILSYQYDGFENILKETYSKNGIISKIDYVGDFYYVDAVPSYIKTSEGKVEIENGVFSNYTYRIKDNKGNIRVNFDKDPLNGSARIIQENNYYSGGMMIGGHPNYVFGEIDNFLYSSKEWRIHSKWYDFGNRQFDPIILRWTSVDPLAYKMPAWSPYSYCFNNPVSFIDPDGQIPYPITIRSFAPFTTFGFGYHGDGRGYSNTPSYIKDGQGPTARAHQRILFDTDKTNISAYGWSSPTFKSSDPSDSKTANPVIKFNGPLSITSAGDSKSFKFGTHSAAANPKTPTSLTPNIDVFSDFLITENKKEGNLNITGTLSGDNFPSTEAFISDPSGQNVFIGVGQIGSDVSKNTGVITELPGENKTNPITSFNITITIDKNGNFTGVQSEGKTYSIEEWNTQFLNKNPQQEELK